MDDLLSFPERLQQVFQPGIRGVIGLVDDFLHLCITQGLRIEWYVNQCRVYRIDPNNPEPIEIPLQKSVFRAILARLAALCNEQSSQAISPYGGEGEIVLGKEFPILRVSFLNTRGEQSAELRPHKVTGRGNPNSLSLREPTVPEGTRLETNELRTFD